MIIVIMIIICMSNTHKESPLFNNPSPEASQAEELEEDGVTELQQPFTAWVARQARCTHNIIARCLPVRVEALDSLGFFHNSRCAILRQGWPKFAIAGEDGWLWKQLQIDPYIPTIYPICTLKGP